MIGLYERIFGGIERATEGWFMGLLARFVFLVVLFWFFVQSALGKIENPDAGLWQIFPKKMEEAFTDPSVIGWFEHTVVFIGAWTELILPILIVVGLLTRLASIAMIGFIFVMSYVDLTAHRPTNETALKTWESAVEGGWFDKVASSQVYDDRTFWVFLLIFLIVKGPGLISVDGIVGLVTDKNKKSAGEA